jgi:tight adherence protein C
VAARLGRLVARRFEKVDTGELGRMLVRAGNYGVTADMLVGYRVLGAVGAPALWIWWSAAVGMGAALAVCGGALFALAGWTVPLSIVRIRGDRRQEQIEYELPELVDLLVVTVEAGIGFVGSMQLAATRMEGPLAEELRLTLQEQRMGLPIAGALSNLLERCDAPSMRSFVRSILQGETLGVSIGEIMRNLSAEMRNRRKMAAEERAQKAPIKILFPLVFLIFPAMLIVLLYPAVVRFVESFG